VRTFFQKLFCSDQRGLTKLSSGDSSIDIDTDSGDGGLMKKLAVRNGEIQLSIATGDMVDEYSKAEDSLGNRGRDWDGWWIRFSHALGHPSDLWSCTRVPKKASRHLHQTWKGSIS
jgi:hypothetical protein